MTPVAIRRAGLDDVPAIAQLFAAYRQFYQIGAEIIGPLPHTEESDCVVPLATFDQAEPSP